MSVAYAGPVLAAICAGTLAVRAVTRHAAWRSVLFTPGLLALRMVRRTSQTAEDNKAKIAEQAGHIDGVYQMMEALCRKNGVDIDGADAQTIPQGLRLVKDEAV
jgi:hypothetical protein